MGHAISNSLRVFKALVAAAPVITLSAVPASCLPDIASGHMLPGTSEITDGEILVNKVRIATFDELDPEKPTHALVSNVDLIVVRWPDEEQVSVLYGRCLHRGALLSDGNVRGEDIVCGLHGWDYRLRTGVSSYTNDDVLHKFTHWIEDGGVFADEDEVREWERCHPQPFDRSARATVFS